MDCPRCGARVGFMNPQIACAACGRPICGECSEWEMFETHARALKIGRGGDRQMQLCSDECAFGQYERFIQAVDPTAPYVLSDAGHINIDLSTDTRSSRRDNIGFNREGLDPMDFTEATSMEPESRPLYDRIRKDLTDRRMAFREDYFDIV